MSDAVQAVAGPVFGALVAVAATWWVQRRLLAQQHGLNVERDARVHLREREDRARGTVLAPLLDALPFPDPQFVMEKVRKLSFHEDAPYLPASTRSSLATLLAADDARVAARRQLWTEANRLEPQHFDANAFDANTLVTFVAGEAQHVGPPGGPTADVALEVYTRRWPIGKGSTEAHEGARIALLWESMKALDVSSVRAATRVSEAADTAFGAALEETTRTVRAALAAPKVD